MVYFQQMTWHFEITAKVAQSFTLPQLKIVWILTFHGHSIFPPMSQLNMDGRSGKEWNYVRVIVPTKLSGFYNTQFD